MEKLNYIAKLQFDLSCYQSYLEFVLISECFYSDSNEMLEKLICWTIIDLIEYLSILT